MSIETQPMDHTNFPLGKPIPIEVFKTFENEVDWNEYYGRWGTEEFIYGIYFTTGGNPYCHEEKGAATHVWMYIEK